MGCAGANQHPREASGPDESAPAPAETVIAALDLLAHFWSRPVADEVARWVKSRSIEANTHRRISADPTRDPIGLPADVDGLIELLDEHERLFVGPGQIPCPPYESFWREDVSVDIHRALVGPCAADLRQIYGELGLKLSDVNGELPDHIAVELEAVAYALTFEETQLVARKLLLEHVGHWLPQFCQAVSLEAEHDFYRDLAAVTIDWLVAIRRYVDESDLAAPGADDRE
ncbi:MAG: molecular chaperone [Acidimicrobiales bacterium]